MYSHLSLTTDTTENPQVETSTALYSSHNSLSIVPTHVKVTGNYDALDTLYLIAATILKHARKEAPRRYGKRRRSAPDPPISTSES